MKFGSGILVGVRSIGVEFSMDFVLLVLSRFDHIGGGFECVLGNSLTEVGVVTPSEGCVNRVFSGGDASYGIIPGMFSLVTRWCVRGAKRICLGAGSVDYVWVVCVGVAGTWSVVSPNIFANFFNASPWRP